MSPVNLGVEEEETSFGGLVVLVFLIAALALPLVSFFFGDSTKETNSFEVIKSSVVNEKGRKSHNSTISSEEPDVSSTNHDPAAEESSSSKATDATQKQSESTAQEEASNSKEPVIDNNQWRCACEGGFLPPGMLQSLGGAEAVLRMSAGQCYHKKL